ncbi:MAG: flagellar basal-body MS-ring/collar protein FliF [Acidimicrobiales bacterium]
MALVPTADFNRMREGVRRFASGFTPGQKAVTIAAVGGALLLAVAYMLLSGKPTYSVLFTNLQPQDAASITQKLTTDHVPYQLQNGSSTILVPQNDVSKERLLAAQAGLPAQSMVGLSLLDKEGLTTSQLTQQADYLQAIQGELEQTIDAIAGVTSSQVNVAEAANQTFALNNTHPTGASVLVTMQQGHTLSQGQVQAIVHLVSSSVPGLASSNVTVADSNGNLLSGPGVSGSAAQNGQTTSYDATEQAKVQSYLASIFGPGSADVQVNATLNFNKVKTSTHQIVPSGTGAPQTYCTNSKTSKTTYKGTGTPPGGTAGTITAPTNGSGTGTYVHTTSTQTCGTSTQTKTVTQSPGTVTNQSIAVLVNAKSVPKGTNMANIKAGVAAAANLRPTRGDVMSFTVAPFNTSASHQAATAAKAAAAAGKSSKMTSMIKDGGAFLVVLVLVLLVWLSSRRRRKAAPTDGMIDPELLPSFSPLEIEPHPTGEIPRTIMPKQDRLGGEIDRFIDDQPEEVASVLRSWLHRGAAATEQRAGVLEL